MEDLRVGLVGYGLAGSAFHAPLLRVCQGMRLAVVVTADPARQSLACNGPDTPLVLSHVDDLWGRRDEVDLVVVAAANRAHVPVALSAIEAGLPVVVDKPLAISVEGARQVVAAASRAGVLLTVFQNRRWDSDQLGLTELVRAGRLGPVLRYESRFERWRPELDPAKWRESARSEDGGGLLLDLGSHLVDQAIVHFGQVAAVYAEVTARRGGADDDVFLALEHASGVRSHLWAGALAGAPGPRLRVLGARAALVVEALDGQEDALRAGRRAAAAAPSTGRLVRGAEEAAYACPPGRWEDFYPAVRAALLDGGPPPVAPAEAVAVLRVLAAARESARRRAVVSLTPDPPG